MHLSIERIKTFPLTELFIVQNSAVYLNILSALCSSQAGSLIVETR